MLKIAIKRKKALSHIPEEIFFGRERRLCLSYYFNSFYTTSKYFVNSSKTITTSIKNDIYFKIYNSSRFKKLVTV